MIRYGETKKKVPCIERDFPPKKVFCTYIGEDQREKLLGKTLEIIRPFFDKTVVVNNALKPLSFRGGLVDEMVHTPGNFLADCRLLALSKANKGDMVLLLDSDECPTPETLLRIREGQLRQDTLYRAVYINHWFASAPSRHVGQVSLFFNPANLSHVSEGTHNFLVSNSAEHHVGYIGINHFKGENAYLLSSFVFWLSNPEHHGPENNSTPWTGPERDRWDQLREKHNVHFGLVQQWVREKSAPDDVMSFIKSLKDNPIGHLHQIYLFVFERDWTVDYPNHETCKLPCCNYDRI